MSDWVNIEAPKEVGEGPRGQTFAGKDLWDAARGVIEHEDRRIDNRLRWMFTLVGFLFAGIAITVNAEVALMTRAAEIEPATFAEMELAVQVFRMSAALIGIIAAAATINGLVAAEIAILRAAKGYQTLVRSSQPLPFAPIGGLATDLFFLTPALWFSITLFGIWTSFLGWTAGMAGSSAIAIGIVSALLIAVLVWQRIKPLVKAVFAERVDDV